MAYFIFNSQWKQFCNVAIDLFVQAAFVLVDHEAFQDSAFVKRLSRAEYM